MFCEQAFSSNCIYFLSNIYKNVEVLSLRLALDPIKLSGLVAGQFQLKKAVLPYIYNTILMNLNMLQAQATSSELSQI